MTKEVVPFSEVVGKADAPWVHVSELIAYVHDLDFSCIDNRLLIHTPDGARSISFPPSNREAAVTIIKTLDDRSVSLLAEESSKAIPQPHAIPRVIDQKGIKRIVTKEETDTARALQAANFMSQMFRMQYAIQSNLMERFAFLTAIEDQAEELSGMLFSVLYRDMSAHGNKEEASKAALSGFREIVGKAKHLHGAEWVRLEGDPNLANRLSGLRLDKKSGPEPT